jgi:membrane-associated phospholipid phosphatase
LHYPSDIMIGYVIGGIIAYLGYSLLPSVLFA